MKTCLKLLALILRFNSRYKMNFTKHFDSELDLIVRKKLKKKKIGS